MKDTLKTLPILKDLNEADLDALIEKFGNVHIGDHKEVEILGLPFLVLVTFDRSFGTYTIENPRPRNMWDNRLEVCYNDYTIQVYVINVKGKVVQESHTNEFRQKLDYESKLEKPTSFKKCEVLDSKVCAELDVSFNGHPWVYWK